MTRPAKAIISRSAFRHNLDRARTLAPNAEVMAVIKADAYGHGLEQMARYLDDLSRVAVACVDEAIQVRRAGFTGRVVVLEGFFDIEELQLARQHHFELVVHNEFQIRMLEEQGAFRQSLWLKFNTGMNRLGFAPSASETLLYKVRQWDGVELVGVMSHFACADEAKPSASVERQIAVFNERIVPFLVDEKISLSNSGAIFQYPEAHHNWIRPGIMLYGSSPIEGASAEQLDLKPVMTLVSEVIAVHELEPGEAVGYGGTWRADKPSRIAIVAMGYGDGYPRHAVNGTPVNVAGQRASIAGRVSMDMLAVDVTGLSGIGIGSPVELWGRQVSVDDVASHAGTIAYELLTGLTLRVPRQYID